MHYQGYYTQAGYLGLVRGKWMLFATEKEYYEYIKEIIYERKRTY